MAKLARQYSSVLITGDAGHLLKLGMHKRSHAMRALSNLAKFSGLYKRWLEIKENHNLKWQRDNDSIFANIYAEEKGINAMLEWIAKTLKILPKGHAKVLVYNTLTGLRPTHEVFDSIKLVKNNLNSYLNQKRHTLEHFRFKDIFFRHGKKAYISIVNENILDLARQAADTNYNTIRKELGRKYNLGIHMEYCRKTFGTWLKVNGIDSEVVDMLQGRLPQSIFAKHYYRPDFQEVTNKITKILQKLEARIPPNFLVIRHFIYI